MAEDVEHEVNVPVRLPYRLPPLPTELQLTMTYVSMAKDGSYWSAGSVYSRRPDGNDLRISVSTGTRIMGISTTIDGHPAYFRTDPNGDVQLDVLVNGTLKVELGLEQSAISPFPGRARRAVPRHAVLPGPG